MGSIRKKARGSHASDPVPTAPARHTRQRVSIAAISFRRVDVRPPIGLENGRGRRALCGSKRRTAFTHKRCIHQHKSCGGTPFSRAFGWPSTPPDRRRRRRRFLMTAWKGSVLATEVVGAQGQGSAVATKAVENTPGRGSVLATEAVETQHKSSV